MSLKLRYFYIQRNAFHTIFSKEAGRGTCSRLLSHHRQFRSTLLAIRHSHPASFSLGSNVSSHVSLRGIGSGSVARGRVVPYKLSDIGEGIVEVVIKEWHIKPGDKINQFDPICEVQSDKASVTISSRYDGIVQKLHYDIDEMAKVGEPLIEIEINDETEIDDAPSGGSGPEKVAEVGGSQAAEDDELITNKALATPAVRRLARENNIKLANVTGSGKSGRVLKEDIISYLENLSGKAEDPPVRVQSAPSPTPVENGQDRVEEIVGIRKAMVKSMTTAWTIPHFSFCDEVSANELVSMKDDLRKFSESKGFKITYMPLLVKAASAALSKYPILNSHVDGKCERITIKSSHNIGVAVDSPDGLVVPNIKNVQRMSVWEIAGELNRLKGLASRGRLTLADVTDGTFTLSNVGNIGGTYTKPILFPPQVVIGGIGKIQVVPRFDGEKKVVEANIFQISWSADHRVVDGATLARFSNLWKLYVEHPRLLLQL